MKMKKVNKGCLNEMVQVKNYHLQPKVYVKLSDYYSGFGHISAYHTNRPESEVSFCVYFPCKGHVWFKESDIKFTPSILADNRIGYVA